MDFSTLKLIFNVTLFLLTSGVLIWALVNGFFSFTDSKKHYMFSPPITEYSKVKSLEEENAKKDGEEVCEEEPESWLDLPEEFLDMGEWR